MSGAATYPSNQTDKAKWLSDKIKKLMDEGKTHEQAVGQAMGMWEDMQKRAHMAKVSNEPWSNFSESDYSVEQLLTAVPSAIASWAREQAKKENRDVIKDDLSLRFKEPDGEININGIRAALSRPPQTQGLPSNVLTDAKKELEELLAKYSDAQKTSKQDDDEFYFTKPIRMPILPAIPGKTVDGRDVPQSLIDAVLAYNPAIRPAIVKLDQESAHGSGNTPALGIVEKTYRIGELVYADVMPQRGYEKDLPLLCDADGPYPFRSIEADRLHLDGNESKTLYLEAISLCGSEKPALNLPSVELTATGNTRVQFTVSLNGDEKMADTQTTKPSDQAIEMAKLKEDFAKQREADREEYAKQIANEREARLKIEADLEAAKIEGELNSKVMLSKLLPDSRAFWKQKLLEAKARDKENAAAGKKISYTVGGKSVDGEYESLLATLRGLPDFLSGKEVANGVPNVLNGEEQIPENRQEREILALAKIRAYAKENKIDADTLQGWEKAEREFRIANPKYFEGVK